jgi:superoxide dismutase
LLQWKKFVFLSFCFCPFSVIISNYERVGVVQEGGGEPPHGKLGWAIDEHFGSFEALIKKMNAEGAALQGSGWVVCTSFLDLFYRK